MTDTRKEIVLTSKDEAVNATQAIIKSLPWIGPGLDQLLFGRLAELRLRRIESTLNEVANNLGRSGNFVETEAFANLLEFVAPHLARAIGEDKRQRFRDLLINAGKHDPSKPEWSAVPIVAEIVSDLGDAALAIVAAIAQSNDQEKIHIVSLPEPQVVKGQSFDWDAPKLIGFPLRYDLATVEEWGWRLKERRLIFFDAHHARGGFVNLSLTRLGRAVVEWAVYET